MSDIGDLIAVGLLGEPNGLGLTANQAYEIGERVAARVAPLDAAWAVAEAALREGWYLGVVTSSLSDDDAYRAAAGTDGYFMEAPAVQEWAATPAAALRALAGKLRSRP